MNNKTGASNLVSSIIFLLILFLGFGAYLFLNNKAKAPNETPEIAKNNAEGEVKQVPATEQAQTMPDAVASDSGTNIKNIPSTYSSGEEMVTSPDIQVVAINYDGKTFSPSTVNIKVGDYVIFYNKSSVAFWPASADHPTHTLYSEFDPKKAIEAGGKFQFQFLKPGSWGFHDHLNSSATGLVKVEK